MNVIQLALTCDQAQLRSTNETKIEPDRRLTCVDFGWVAKRGKTCVDGLVCKFDLGQTERKSTQVNASQRNWRRARPGQKELQVDA